MQRSFCAHKQRRIDILYTEPLPQRNLCTEQFLHKDFVIQKQMIQRNLYTQTAQKTNTHRTFCTQKLYPEQLLQSKICFCTKTLTDSFFFMRSNFTDRRFLHRKFSAQKCYAQKVLRTTFFTYRRFYTQMLLH